ncbi:MAG: fibronectin type III domain-containing protein, partial [Acidobacteriota bacterium]
MTRVQTRRIAILMAVLAVCLGSSALAQNIGNYAATRNPGIVYSSIEFTGSSMPAWRNDTPNNSNEDDNRSYAVPIGFDFWYNGVRYTNFSVSTNGFIDFSTATYDGGPGTGTRQYWPYGPYDADLSSNARTNGLGGTALAIAPIYYDITTQGEIDPLGESIKYQVDGLAPNRVLTVEWIRMAVWQNTSPNLNYQVKLYEGSGVIEMIYGTMNAGTGVAWSYSCGLSGANAGTTHLIQTAANTNSFSTASTQNNLTAIPASNSMIAFTPPSIAAPGSLTFTNVTQTSMQLNWTDIANEVGYVIYRSDDGGATYNFITQTAPNTTSYLMTDLLAGMTYYYKVYAVNEGRLSSPLLGNTMTVVPATFISIKSGSWNDPLTWNNPANGLPDITSAVTISDGHTVTIDGPALASTITVGRGTSGILYIGNSDNTARTLSVTGNITVNNGARFGVNPVSVQTGHSITTTGNFINSGTIDLAPTSSSRCIVNFTKSGTQTISGYGPTTNFGVMNLNMGSSSANILDVFATNFADAVPNFLTITNGTFKLSAASTVTPFTGDAGVPVTGGLWLNHPGAVVTTTGGSLTVTGFLRVTNGTLTVGNLADHRLISNGGTFTFEQGTVNIAGRFEPLNNFTLTNFIMSGGTIITPTVGSTSTVNAPFTINVPGSNFEMTGGTIIIRKPGGSNTGYINTSTSTSNVLGGTLQMGDSQTPASQLMQIKTDVPLFNLSVNGNGTTAQIVTNAVTVKNNVSVASTGILDPSNLTLTVGGNWTDNGTFVRGKGTVVLYSTSTQTIQNPLGETFKNLTIDKDGGSVTLNGSVTVDSVFTLAQGALSIGSSTLTFNYTAQSAGTVTMSRTAPFGTVAYNQPSAGQAILPLNYGNLTLNAYSKTFPSAGSIGIAGTLTVPNPATAHVTAGSTIDYNGASQPVAATTTNFVYQNLSLSGSGTKTAAGAATVNGGMTIASGVSFADAGATITVKGNIENNGTHTGTGKIQVNGGSAAHTLSGSGSYTNFTMNDALGAALSGSMTVNGTLTFTGGVITTGADTVYANGPVTRTSGHVYGWLRRTFTTANSNQPVTFDLGDAAPANYTPAVFTFPTITAGGTVTAAAAADQHPQIGSSYIDPTDDVARYWTLKPANGFGFTPPYTAKFTFLASDLAQTTNVLRYKINCYSGGWDSAGVTTATATTNQGGGLTKLGSYAIGLQGANNMYRSIASGNWTTPGIWQRFNGATGQWVAATDYPRRSTATSVSVQSPNIITVNSDLSGTQRGQDQVVIDAGATVRIVAGGTFEIRNGTGTDLSVYGTLEVAGGTFTTNNSPAISFEAGGTYLHAVNGGTIPGATWDPSSNCVITGAAGTAPGGLNQTFGNFHWNCTGQNAALLLGGNPATVTGEFRITSTGSSSLTLNNTNTASKTIGGNFVVAGGTVIMKNTGATPYTVNVSGGFSLTGGAVLTLTQSSNTGGDVTVNVAGNVSVGTTGQLLFTTGTTNGIINAARDFAHTSGTMTETSTGTGLIVFNGNRVQNYISGGTVTNIINYTVNSGTTLQLGTNVITGGGSFTLSNGATIALGSPAGISTAAGTGNVQVTGAKSFGTGANYIYNGTTGAQSTGNALPATVNKLTIGNGSGVTLTSSVTVSDTLLLQDGMFSIGSTTLTLNNAVVPAGGTLSAPSGTVHYYQASDGQNVLAANYGNLRFSNYAKLLPPSAVIGVAGTFVPGTSTGHVMSNSTFNYNGAGSQSVVGFNYYNLTTSGGGTKTLTGNAVVDGMLTLGASAFADGGYQLTVKGNIYNTTAHTGSGRIYLNGSSSTHQLTGGGSYTNLEINDENGAVIVGNTTCKGTLTLTRGIITTSDTLFIDAGGFVARPTTGLPRHINGFLKKSIPAMIGVSQTIIFEIG